MKSARQSERRRVRNRVRKQRLKLSLKQIKTAKTKKDAQELLSNVQAVIDKSVRAGIIHRNKAARLKSRLARAASKLA